MFEYQKSERFFAQVADGLSEISIAELRKLGATDIKTAYRGVYFSADHKALYRINYRARFITRVFAPLISFDCHSTKYLHKTLLPVEWEQILSLEQTFAVTANVSDSRVRHGQYASRVVKDAVVDHFREKTGKRPNVDPKHPDLWLHLHLHRNKATLHLDTSGGSLHRRGYRERSIEAPMMETLAAGLVELSGWDGERPLADPMCGSGTLLSEALIKACRIPAGYLRSNWGFERLPDFDPKLWKRVKDKADSSIIEIPEEFLFGNDYNSRTVEIARHNNSLLPYGDRITWRSGDFRKLHGLPNCTILCNPPYGVRLERGGTVPKLLADLGDFLKQKCTGSDALIYVGDKELLKEVGLRPKWKMVLRNGPLDGRLALYELY